MGDQARAPCTQDSSPEAMVQAGDARARPRVSTVPRLIGALPGTVATAGRIRVTRPRVPKQAHPLRALLGGI